MEIKFKKFSNMNSGKIFLKRVITLITGLVLILPVASYAQDGQALFKGNCGACHRVGGGRLVGPDLSGITTKRTKDWLMKWTKSSTAFIASGDADAKAIFAEYNNMPMPDQKLSDDELTAIFTYIDSKSAVATTTDTAKAEAPKADASLTATAADIAMGRNLFVGRVPFTNGGPACISCHNINYKDMVPGGLLAKDLTTSHSRLGGDAGLQGILGAPPFPAMTQSYKDRAITEKEIANIIAFLAKVDKDKPNQVVSEMNPLLYGGAFGLCVLLVFIFILWFARKKHTTKKDIYDRQLKSY